MADDLDVRARVDDALQRAAARAYQAAHGVLGEQPDLPASPPWRWAVSPRVAVTAALVAMLVAAVVVWGPREQAPRAAEASSTPSASVAVADRAPVALTVSVHVAGAVMDPGMYQLVAGSRVVDAVEAAGGVGPDADLDAVNLARELVDGEQVRVPAMGETGELGQSGSDGRVNINVADAVALEALPGIGPVLAGRMVAYRDAHGPFGSVEDLDAVTGVGPAVLAGLVDAATV